jgi:streptomycin 6-kinase
MFQKSLALPENFVRQIRETFQERGDAWLERLPTLLADCERRWNLTLLPAFPNLSFNYVAPVTLADGSPAVLKAGVPHKELFSEMEALRLYDGRGSVRLLEADSEQGIMILERLQPGTMLTGLADEAHDAQATSIAADVMRGLWRPVTDAETMALFPTTGDWMQGLQKMRAHFGGGSGPFRAALMDEAEGLAKELLASQAAPVLLHGDLHHDNILASQRGGWLAIDPKGILGEPAYEVGALLRNFWQDRHMLSDLAQITEHRVYQLAEELNLDRARVRGWGVAQAVLSAWWGVEDGGEMGPESMETAELIAAVKV